MGKGVRNTQICRKIPSVSACITGWAQVMFTKSRNGKGSPDLKG